MALIDPNEDVKVTVDGVSFDVKNFTISLDTTAMAAKHTAASMYAMTTQLWSAQNRSQLDQYVLHDGEWTRYVTAPSYSFNADSNTGLYINTTA